MAKRQWREKSLDRNSVFYGQESLLEDLCELRDSIAVPYGSVWFPRPRQRCHLTASSGSDKALRSPSTTHFHFQLIDNHSTVSVYVCVCPLTYYVRVDTFVATILIFHNNVHQHKLI